MQKFLIVGLGNIGNQYERTRHNVGFLFVDYLAQKLSCNKFKSKTHGIFTEYSENDFSILLLKPTTLMNISGKALLEFKKFYNPNEIIVIHDDLDMKLCKIRLKYNSGDGGHNGLKSIRQYIGNEYWKLKIGIERPINNVDVKNYVLSNFQMTELKELEKLFEKMVNHFEFLLNKKDQFVSKIMS